MNKRGPIIIIDDDEDDHLLLDVVFRKLNYPNQIVYFHNGQQALTYLGETTEMPFLILSDINMPIIDGFSLRQQIYADTKLRAKCIPYLFFSTAVSEQMVTKAYGLSVQGFFVKHTTFTELEETIKIIMEYWIRCVAPGNF